MKFEEFIYEDIEDGYLIELLMPEDEDYIVYVKFDTIGEVENFLNARTIIIHATSMGIDDLEDFLGKVIPDIIGISDTMKETLKTVADNHYTNTYGLFIREIKNHRAVKHLTYTEDDKNTKYVESIVSLIVDYVRNNEDL